MDKRKRATGVLITAILVSLVFAVLPMSAADQESTGMVSGSSSLAPSILATAEVEEYKVLVVEETYLSDQVETRLEGMGATVDRAAAATLTPELLAGYDILWIGLNACDDVTAAGKDSVVADYIWNGGAVNLEQPNVVGEVTCVPYHFYVSSMFWLSDNCDVVLVDPTHPIVTTPNVLDPNTRDVPDTYDTIEWLDPNYHVVAETATNAQPTLFVAEYGAGRIVVDMDITCTGGTVCDPYYPSISDEYYENDFMWKTKGAPEAQTLTPLGLVALVGLLSSIAVLTMRRKRC